MVKVPVTAPTRPLSSISLALIQILQDKPLTRNYGTNTEEEEEKEPSESDDLREKIEYLELQL